MLNTPENQKSKLDEMITFTQALTEAIPVWKNIASIPEDKKSKIIDIRAGDYVCLEGEGLGLTQVMEPKRTLSPAWPVTWPLPVGRS